MQVYSLHVSELTVNVFKIERYSLYILQHFYVIHRAPFSWKYYISIIFLQ